MTAHTYLETTEWADGGAKSNHIYVFTERPTGRTAQAVAYVPSGRNRVVRLRTPLTLDLRGRTFELVK